MRNIGCLVVVVLISVILGFAAAADQNNRFETYFVAHGGCKTITAYPTDIYFSRHQLGIVQNDPKRSLDEVELFGKSVLKWSDDDIATALSVFRDCKARAPDSVLNFWESKYGMFERGLRSIVMTARNLDAQRKGQQQAKIELEKGKAEEAANEAAQAEKERKAAEEERKIAENQRAIAQAIKDRQATEEKADREKHEAELRTAERNREVEFMPLTATDIQIAVDKVGKFVADYSTRKIDASNVEARLNEATRAADEASRLIQTVKDHMTADDDPATLTLENKIVALRPHLEELRAKIVGIPQEIAQEKAEKDKADRRAQVVAEEETDRQRDAKEVESAIWL